MKISSEEMTQQAVAGENLSRGVRQKETLIMIITDGTTFRAFRLIRRRREAEPEIEELTIPVPLETAENPVPTPRPERLSIDSDIRQVQRKPFRPLSAGVLARLTAQIEKVVRQEQADFWNLVAPGHFIFQLGPRLDPAVYARLRRVSFADVLALRGQFVA